MMVGFADGCSGYIPPLGEYRHGGYEVEEAHRYYGLPAAFAVGAAENWPKPPSPWSSVWRVSRS